MLANVQQATIRPIIETGVARGTLIHTDEYDVYARLKEWGYGHKTVCHARGEYARDDDGDGFCEVHVNTTEGFWSLLRSWLRPHRGISQEKLPLYLGFFQFVHNTRRRGKALLGTLVAALKIGDLDSDRMLIRVEHGKGGKDRYVMLSPHLLTILRIYWRLAKPAHWLFPGRDQGRPVSTATLQAACRVAVREAGLYRSTVLRHRSSLKRP